MKLYIVPLGLDEANAFVDMHHRHHKPVVGCKFTIGCASGSKVVGVAIVGRPKSRVIDDGFTAEINRLCSDGTRNVCSKLLSAIKKIARIMGYRRLLTYTLPEEGGSSLRAAGYRQIGLRGGGKWDTPSRPRVDTHPTQKKLLWEAPL